MKNKRLPLSAARPLTDNVLVGLRLVILQCIYECLLAGVSSRRTREIILGGGWPSLLFYAIVMGGQPSMRATAPNVPFTIKKNDLLDLPC